MKLFTPKCNAISVPVLCQPYGHGRWCSPALVQPDRVGVGADIRWVGHLSATLPKLALHLEANLGGLEN